jgi:hypothetical protein
MAEDEKKQIILAQFDGVPELLEAAGEMRDAGYTRFDCHSPFPIHGMNTAMGIRRSRLSILVGFFALVGLTGAYYMQYWMSAVNYPIIISGKPFNSYPADTPVIFALAVLLAAFAAFFGMLALSRLPRFNHPLFSSERFDKFSDNGFFISVESEDPKFGLEETTAFLSAIGGKHLEVLQA